MDCNITTELTYSCWFKRTGNPTYVVEADGNEYGHQVIFGDAWAELTVNPQFAIRCGVYVNGVRQVFNFGIGKISMSNWTHLAFTAKENDAIKGYINGNFVGEAEIAKGTIDQPLSRKIGDYNSDSYGMNGYVKSVGIWNRVLTANEIKILTQF